MVQIGKQLDDVIVKLEELPAKLSFNITTLKKELELTNDEVPLMKEDIADLQTRSVQSRR